MWIAVLATLASAVLYYLANRQQRWLTRPLPPITLLAALGLLVLAALFWAGSLGPAVGLFAGFWSFVAVQLMLVLLAGHYRDSFQKGGGEM